MKHLKDFFVFETIQLDFYDKGLTALPELPDNLIYLYCSHNILKYLPELPKTLVSLYCNGNELTHLPKLPETLKTLFCDNNKLTKLPVLPNNLLECYCGNNPLECLIPLRFLRQQDTEWRIMYYNPFIKSYDGQKKILTDQPELLNELKAQTQIHPKIKNEFYHLFTGEELNLL